MSKETNEGERERTDEIDCDYASQETECPVGNLEKMKPLYLIHNHDWEYS